jgi:hypothetical protein
MKFSVPFITSKISRTGYLTVFLLAVCCVLPQIVWCNTPDKTALGDDINFKPLVDNTSIHNLNADNSDPSAPSHYSAQPAFSNRQQQQSQPLVLTGKILTFQEALKKEDSINWYQWYLEARRYLAETGGLACPLGTDIVFYLSGQIETTSSDTGCQLSLKNRRFPLPVNSQLEALILPVRSSQHPPASRTELQSRVQDAQK